MAKPAKLTPVSKFDAALALIKSPAQLAAFALRSAATNPKTQRAHSRAIKAKAADLAIQAVKRVTRATVKRAQNRTAAK